MNFDSNSPDEIAKRKAQDILKLSGTGIILFAFWDIVKLLLQILTDSAAIFGDLDTEVLFFVWIMLVIVIGIDTLLRLYIWRHAVRESRGEPSSNGHIIMSALIFIIDLAALFIDFRLNSIESMTVSTIIDIIISLTGELLLIDVIVETIKLRGLNKRIKEED